MGNQQRKRKGLPRTPDSMTDAALLELLLQFTRDDAAEFAEKILQQFPSIADVMEAGKKELATVEGMDDETVLLLRLVPELHRRYFLSRSRTETRLTDSHDYGNYLLPYFYGARDEMVYLLLLDGAGRVINCRLLGEGSVSSANVPIRRLVQEALTANAAAVVLAHNHPAGIALPSKEDVEITVRLREALEIMDIVLLDHIVVADDDFVSLRESGYLRRF
ncbi:MAG: DNA repair protein RadC [Clostridiales bacterium]|nr:DNA repair protein RadC [Clostridiales bacterium]